MALTEVQKVRYLIGDSDSAIITDDDVISSFLTENDEDINLAAADLCGAIAADSVLLDKAIKIGSFDVDRKGLVNNYLKLAERLKIKAEQSPAFAIVEQTVTDFQYDQIIENKALREG